jgi:hypothetical protein
MSLRALAQGKSMQNHTDLQISLICNLWKNIFLYCNVNGLVRGGCNERQEETDDIGVRCNR